MQAESNVKKEYALKDENAKKEISENDYVESIKIGRIKGRLNGSFNSLIEKLK